MSLLNKLDVGSDSDEDNHIFILNFRQSTKRFLNMAQMLQRKLMMIESLMMLLMLTMKLSHYMITHGAAQQSGRQMGITAAPPFSPLSSLDLEPLSAA